ncbi:hypothetical protein ACRW16_09090 [Escherichia coli]|nr:hypothetical protein [Escherichia coli]
MQVNDDADKTPNQRGDPVLRLGRDQGATMRAFMEPRQSVVP